MWRERHPFMRPRKKRKKEHHEEEPARNVTIVAASKTFKVKPLKQVCVRG